MFKSTHSRQQNKSHWPPLEDDRKLTRYFENGYRERTQRVFGLPWDPLLDNVEDRSHSQTKRRQPSWGVTASQLLMN